MGKETPVSSVTAVRPQIKNMVSPGNDEDFEKSLPNSTAAPVGEGAEPQKRKRRTKEEMAASRGEVVSPGKAPAVDPLMQDERYAKIMGEMSGGGGKEIVSLGFRASGKPLNTAEQKRIDDMFYVMAMKGGWNPAQSWFAIMLYFFLAVLGPMIIERTDVIEKLKALFEQPMKMPDKKAEEKAPEVKA